MFFDLFERSRGAGRTLAAALLGGLLCGAGPALAQEGAIAGTVTDQETLEPVAGAQVFIPGTVIGGLTGERGSYRLEGVPVGEHRLSVQLIGYKDEEQTVQVQAGQVSTADFQLEQTALRIQDIVVTGVIGETPRVKLPFTVERLDAADLPVATSDVSTLLHGKTPGISVVKGSGQPGDAASIISRGPKSINAEGRSNGPLIIIDGVVQSQGATLADINALDIDHIEIVKGAAAASLYGARAQFGVIQVSTKRGTRMAPNTFNVTVRNEYGIGSLEGDFEVARSHPFATNDAGTAFLVRLADGSVGEVQEFTNVGRQGFGDILFGCPPWDPGCDPLTVTNTAHMFQDNAFPGQLHDHIDEFFDPGETFSNYVAASGKFGESSFRASFENFREAGIINCSECAGEVEHDGYWRRNARLNVDTRAFGDFDVALSGFYSNSNRDDIGTFGPFFGLTFASPGVDLTETDEDGLPRVDIDPRSQEENPLYQLAIIDDTEERQRVMGSLDVVWQPLDWFALEGDAAYDRTDFDRKEFRPKGEKNHSGDGVVTFTGGRFATENFFEQAVNATLTASFNQTFADGNLTTRAKVGLAAEEQEFEQARFDGTQLTVEGVPNFDNVRGRQQGENEFQEFKSLGYSAIGTLDYKGKYILDGLVRRDGSSLFGADERWHTYWRGSAAWRISQEEWWNIDAVNEFKLRYSQGTAGGRPNFFAQFETFGIRSGQVFPINLGNRDLKPEFSREQEAGTNLVLFDRIGIDFTYAWSTTDDQLLLVPQPSFLGFSGQWVNAGEIESETIEGSLRASIIDRADVGWTIRISADRTDQVISRLDIPSYTDPGAGAAGVFTVEEGEELGTFIGHRWATSCADLAPRGVTDCGQFQVNDDGYLVWVGQGNEFTDGIANQLWGMTGNVQGLGVEFGLPILVLDQSPSCLRQNPGGDLETCPLTNQLPIGSSTPDFNASFATNFRYKGLSIAGLLDASVGFDIYNSTMQWAWRDGSQRGIDIDQAGKAEGLKKPLKYYSILYDTNASNVNFVEDGSWLKVRELSVGYTFGQDQLRGLFGNVLDRVTLNVIGRNLLTFTDYRGYDPEVGTGFTTFGTTAVSRDDAFGYPNFRTMTASLELVF